VIVIPIPGRAAPRKKRRGSSRAASVALLVRRNVMRHPVRAALTFTFSALALFLFVFLYSVITTLGAAAKIAATNRIVVQSAVSLFVYMPEGYEGKIAAMEGVESVEPWNWFGGYYKDPKNMMDFGQFAAKLPVLLEQYPELSIAPEQIAEVLADRKGCILGEETAVKYGWKVGDTIPLFSTIYSLGADKAWEFHLRATYRSLKDNLDSKTMFFHWEYLQETRKKFLQDGFTSEHQQVGIFMVKVKPGYRSEDVIDAIDAQFEAGPQRTRTQTEAAFQAQFVSMLGSLPTLLSAVGGAVLFAIFFSVLNTCSMAARERSRDVGILKALGFPDSLAARLLLAESMLVVGAGGLLGIGLSFLAEKTFRGTFGILIPNYFVEPKTALIGLGIALGVGFFAGLLPALRLTRLRTVDVLREGA
jgi:putative ABC transport system permease protein